MNGMREYTVRRGLVGTKREIIDDSVLAYDEFDAYLITLIRLAKSFDPEVVMREANTYLYSVEENESITFPAYYRPRTHDLDYYCYWVEHIDDTYGHSILQEREECRDTEIPEEEILSLLNF